MAPVAHLQIVSASLIAKPDYIRPDSASLKALLVRDDDGYLDEEARDLANEIASLSPLTAGTFSPAGATDQVDQTASPYQPRALSASAFREGWSTFSIDGGNVNQAASLETEVRACFGHLRGELSLSLNPASRDGTYIAREASNPSLLAL